MPLTMCSELFGDFVPRHDSFCVRALARGGFRDRRQDDRCPRWASFRRPIAAVRAHPESLGTRSHAGRLERRAGGGGRGRPGPDRAWQRWRWFDPDPGGVLRTRRAQAGSRPGLSRPDSGQSFLVGDGVLSRTWRTPPPCSTCLRAMSRRCELGAAGGRGLLGGRGRRRPAFNAPLRIGLALNMPLDGADVDPVCIAAARDAAALLSSLGHVVEEVVPPWSGLGLPPTSRARSVRRSR